MKTFVKISIIVSVYLNSFVGLSQNEPKLDSIYIRFGIQTKHIEKFLHVIKKDTVLVNRYRDNNGYEYLKFSKPLNKKQVDSLKVKFRKKKLFLNYKTI